VCWPVCWPVGPVCWPAACVARLAVWDTSPELFRVEDRWQRHAAAAWAHNHLICEIAGSLGLLLKQSVVPEGREEAL